MQTELLPREVLKQKAEQLGMEKQIVERTTDLILQNFIYEAEARNRKQRHRHRKVTQENMQQTIEQLHDQAKEDFEDDNATVVDLQFITAAANPSDQKFNRFRELAKYKDTFLQAIKANTQILQEDRQKAKNDPRRLDQDDVDMYEKDIRSIQDALIAVTKEMHEIETWFNEVSLERQQYYIDLKQRSVDVTGAITSHFQKKCENIQKYMSAFKQPVPPQE